MLYVNSGNLEISDTVFEDNHASFGTGVLTGSNLTGLKIENTKFLGNSSATNYGIGAVELSLNDNSLIGTISNTIFKDNKTNTGNSSEAGALELGKGTFILNNVDFINNEAGEGGAIHATGNLTINNSLLDGNTAGGSLGGGAIAFSGYKLAIDNTIIQNNKSLIDHDGGAILLTDGGSNPPTIEYIKNSQFNTNSSAYDGGAISSSGIIKYIENTVFDGNAATKNGGAIYLGLSSKYINQNVVPLIYNSEFKNNTAEVNGGAIIIANGSANNQVVFVNTDFDGNSAKNYGGAIYNWTNTPTMFVDSSFKNNSAVFGGAVFTYPDITILADNKDVIFENNTASSNGADIYFYKTLNLAANDGKKIEFNSGVNASDINTSIMNINEKSYSYNLNDGSAHTVGNTGTICLNNYITKMTINLYGGTLSIGQNMDVNALVSNPDGFISSSYTNLYIKGDSIINTINNKIGIMQPNEFKVESGVNWQYQFDIDLANKTSDKIVVTENGGNLNLSKLNIFSDTDEENVKVKYSDTNLNAILKDGYKITTSENTYKIATENNDADGSSLIISRDNSAPIEGGGLAGAIANSSDVFTNTSGTDEIVKNWFGSDGNQLKNDMEIDANGLGIVSETNIDGIIIASGKTLTINDAKDFSGFNNAITNNGTLNLNNSVFTNNTGDSIITNNNGTVNISSSIKDVIFDNSTPNSISSNGGEINITGNNKVIFEGNVIGNNDAVMNISSDVNFNKEITGIHIIHTGGNVLIDSHNSANYNLHDGTLHLKSEENFLPDTLTLGGGSLNLINGSIGTVNINNLVVNSSTNTNFGIDVDLKNEQMDRLLSNNFDIKSTYDDIVTNNGLVNVNRFNVLSDTNKSFVSINFTDSALKDYITTDIKSVMGPIFNYGVSYNKETGNFNFMGGGSNSSGYNPAVLASPIAAQLGGYLTQLNSYDEAFRNMDMYMLMSKKDRQALKLRNKYAATDSNLIFNPTMSRYYDKAGWVRPYATFENVPLKNGPRVSNVAYGSFFGVDSELYDLGHGWDGMFGVYVGYNGSHQTYNGIGIYQNGGTLGAVGMAYKGNFFTGLTINTGANTGEASTMYGQDNFAMLMAGIASKTGYNFEMADNKFIIQPSLLMSYSFVNTFDYTNAAGVRINSDPLNAIQIEPGIKFIGNLKNGWQPYASVSMVWNIMDQTRFHANDVSLPDLSVRPFVKYGVGVQKRWGERFVGFFQTYFTNGGRNGVGLQLGFRWSIGKSTTTNSKKTNNGVPQLPPANISLVGMK